MIAGLGDKLKLLRKQHRLTQAQVANRLATTPVSISAYELGITVPPVDVLMKLAVMYGTSVDYLLGLTHTPTITIDGVNEEQASTISEITRTLIALARTRRDTNDDRSTG